jgi:hypothetical protein
MQGPLSPHLHSLVILPAILSKAVYALLTLVLVEVAKIKERPDRLYAVVYV